LFLVWPPRLLQSVNNLRGLLLLRIRRFCQECICALHLYLLVNLFGTATLVYLLCLADVNGTCFVACLQLYARAPAGAPHLGRLGVAPAPAVPMAASEFGPLLLH
jgi:hypothetical protein